jgi:hypothetical protein
MCFFITLAVPAEHAGLVTQIADQGFAIRPQTNRSISKHVGARATFVLTSGGCSCDLYASEADDGHAALKELNTARRKYAKLGWSAPKIERALAARHTSADRRSRFVGLRSDAREIVVRIAEAVGELGPLVHAYSGDIDEEAVLATQGACIDPDDLRSGTTSLAEDVILWIWPECS